MSQLKISIFSHEDDFIDLLYSSKEEFEGQLTSPVISEKTTGEKTLSFSIPLKIFDKKEKKIIDNPRWDFLVNQYKIRVEENDKIEEYVMNNFVENHNEQDQIMMEVQCESLAEFELTKIGYDITFDENSLYIYEENTDPNDIDNKPIGLHTADIHFWNKKLLENTSWNYEVQSFYEKDTELEHDNRQDIPTEEQPYIGKNQFYEDDRIIDYDENNKPIKSQEYTIKERIIKESKSSIFNITQTIAENFEVWVGYIITYENGKINEKKIIYKNSVPENSLFSINYQKNLKSANRTIDSSSIVTKMYVTTMNNTNTDNGSVSIADTSKNFMKENYLLDFSWYLGEDRKEDIDLENKELLNPDLGMTFPLSVYAPSYKEEKTTTKTVETIEEYQKNIRARNIYIEDLSLKLSQAQEDLTNLKSSYDLYLAKRDAAQENIDNLIDEVASLPQGEQVKNNRVFYLYTTTDGLQITFSEEGVKELPRPSTFNSPINLLSLDGKKYVDKPEAENEIDVKSIELQVLTRDSILQTITSAFVKNVKLGEEETYGSFKGELIYNPLEYNQKLIDYWSPIVKSNDEIVQTLGLTKENGGTITTTSSVFSGIEEGIAYLDFSNNNYFSRLNEGDYILLVIKGKEKYYIIDVVDKTNELIGIKSSDFSDIIVGEEIITKILGRIYGKELIIDDYKQKLYQARLEKNKIVKEFEKLLYPFVREGYWEDSSYTTYMNKMEEKNSLGPTEEIYETAVTVEKWSDDYWSYLIPNPLLGYLPDGEESKPIYLYDVIDIKSIEVMSNNIVGSEYDENFKVYVPASTDKSGNATNYTVDYGYTNTDEESLTNRGIYINFYEPYSSSAFTQDSTTQMYVRIKARGTGNYVWEGYIGNQHFTNNDGVTKRMFFAQLTQELILDQVDIILDSIKVTLNTAQLNYITTDTKELKPISYDLVYGTDYYSYKETKDNKTYTKIRLSNSTNVPLGSFDIPNTYISYTVNCNYDTTSKYYYNDALKILKESSIPQVTYSINVVDLSKLILPHKDYSLFKPEIGKRVLIYDKELRLNGILGFISEISRDLLSPENNVITISDYKDKFEDLFEKITAATVQLQNNYDYFSKATEALDSSGNINTNLLENALMENNTKLSMSESNDVTWDESGITITDKKLNENGIYGKIKLTAGGIFMADSYDQYGNYKWQTAITPSFINASKMTVGHIDTRQIQLWNSSQPRFLWNENGIYAYGLNNGVTDYNTYVLFNQDGLKFRALSTITESIDLINEVKNSNFSSADYWESTINGAGIPTLDIVAGNVYNILKSTSEIETDEIIIKQTTSNYDSGHKYYYRVEVNIENIPQNLPATISVGFTSLMKTYDYNSNKMLISGFVNSLTPEDFFTIRAKLSSPQKDWKLTITEPIIIDITKSCGEETDVDLNFLDTIPFFIEGETYKNSYEAYADALSLTWSGLKIGAQRDALTLSSSNGLEVFQPASIAQGGKQLRVQVGMWEEETTVDGTIVLTKKYGIRGLNANGVKIFELSQDGFLVRYEDEDTPIDDLINNSVAYNVLITSSNGNSFINGQINTILTATVYKGQTDITKQLQNNNFIWTRVSDDSESDDIWNYEHQNIGNQVTITNYDFDNKAVFNCSIEIEEE